MPADPNATTNAAPADQTPAAPAPTPAAPAATGAPTPGTAGAPQNSSSQHGSGAGGMTPGHTPAMMHQGAQAIPAGTMPWPEGEKVVQALSLIHI